jgi:hypothetical protein
MTHTIDLGADNTTGEPPFPHIQFSRWTNNLSHKIRFQMYYKEYRIHNALCKLT